MTGAQLIAEAVDWCESQDVPPTDARILQFLRDLSSADMEMLRSRYEK